MRIYDPRKWSVLKAFVETRADGAKRIGVARRLAAFRLLTPIERPAGRRLRVLIYARYSTEEQNPRSIDDQFTFCIAFL